MKLVKVRAINRAVLDHYQKGCGVVLCEVVSEEDGLSFMYEVLGARSREGVFQVKTINGWKVPYHVFVQPVVAE